MRESSLSGILQGLLIRLKAGDVQARDELIELAYDRLLLLTRKMLGRYSRLRAWEESSDITHGALLRLRSALEQVQPASLRDFIGLASLQIRHELIDLSRHYYGRKSTAALEAGKHVRPQAPLLFSQQRDDDSRAPGADERDLDTLEAKDLAIWREFHEKVQSLDDDEREVVEMLWYQELTQKEAAELIGVDQSTVKRRWRAARRQLAAQLDGWLYQSDKRPDEFNP